MISFENGVFTLQNDLFCRKMRLDPDGLRSISFRLTGRDMEFAVIDTPPEFTFRINDIPYSGYAPGEQKLKFRDYTVEKGGNDAEILNIVFDLPEGQGSVTLVSVIYPDLPGTVRKIRFSSGKEDLKVTQLIVETFNLAPRKPVDYQLFREQGRLPALPQFTITGSDDMIRGHDEGAQAGFFTGSAVPGPLRYVMCYPHWATGIRYGYSHSVPVFAKYIAPGEEWCSDEFYLVLYSGGIDDCRGRNDFRELVRRSMPELTAVAGPMFCTWIPFLKEINEKLVSEVAAAASECGFGILVLDDGWFVDGPWQIDKEKFPNGLEKVAADVRSNGLKFGLWFNIGTDYGWQGSMPENNCTLSDGTIKKCGVSGVRCFASAHRDRISEKLLDLAERYGVDYFKMDFSNIISPYGIMPAGCFSHDHAYHRDGDDAVVEEYRSFFALRQKLKSVLPDLCLDYSFEVFGTEYPDIAGLQFSDIQHVSNLHVTPDFYDVRQIREAIYAFTAMLPPERISGSLIELLHGQVFETIYTSLAGNPLMAGDLRQLSAEERTAAANIFAAFRELSADGPLTDMQVWQWNDGKSAAGSTDGYFRWSRKSGNGMAAVFANSSGAKSVTARFAIPDDSPRILLDMNSGRKIGTFSAGEMRKGIELSFEGAGARGFVVKKVKI